ncbi:hypothetical protein HMPREF3033_01788 [Veillonellaceae bacterium DNF00751]|nr:hypothetical protein HMPREF3033_01788 [Veillonellaceae bacterium DNF00751]
MSYFLYTGRGSGASLVACFRNRRKENVTFFILYSIWITIIN